jgi:predicted metal-binding membrane protein
MTAIAWRRVSIALSWRPEWPVTLLVGVCWLLLALLSLQGDGSHGVRAAHAAYGVHAASAAQSFAPAMLLASWLLMSCAMMVPATLPAVRHVAFNSIATRRARAMIVYVASYLAVWVVFGVIAFTLVESIRTLFVSPSSTTSDRLLLAIALTIAAIWQLTRIKRRAIVACRRTVPLPPDGLAADRACARFGVLQAWRCLIACWPLMLSMAIMRHPHPLLPTIALTLLVLAEERAPNRDRLIAPIAALFAVSAVILLVVTLSSTN